MPMRPTTPPRSRPSKGVGEFVEGFNGGGGEDIGAGDGEGGERRRVVGVVPIGLCLLAVGPCS